MLRCYASNTQVYFIIANEGQEFNNISRSTSRYTLRPHTSFHDDLERVENVNIRTSAHVHAMHITAHTKQLQAPTATLRTSFSYDEITSYFCQLISFHDKFLTATNKQQTGVLLLKRGYHRRGGKWSTQQCVALVAHYTRHTRHNHWNFILNHFRKAIKKHTTGCWNLKDVLVFTKSRLQQLCINPLSEIIFTDLFWQTCCTDRLVHTGTCQVLFLLADPGQRQLSNYSQHRYIHEHQDLIVLA